MNTFNAMRRDFLRFGSYGLAAAAIPAFTANAQDIASSPGIFDVRKYGAMGDGKTLDTDAVNRAIDAAAAAGGGMVVFSPGTYVCFSIHLKSHVHLHLQQGSILLAADSPLPGEQSGYTEAPTMQPKPTCRGRTIRTTVTITGTTHDLGRRTSRISASPAQDSSGARAFPTDAAAKAWRTVCCRAGRRGQQGHRAQELPQCPGARRFNSEGWPLCLVAHRRRQPHARQPQDRYRSRWHRYRLLPECAGFQLHRQLALG